MTYVSRRARITVPRWPNEFDPEFLFRVGRRCDGRLKRHSSCHDLRAWINDNCIKHEYLLELMSDGEVVLSPPLQLYGRFIPVPLLFKLLQSSGSEKGLDNIDWEKIGQETPPEGSGKGRGKGRESKAGALGSEKDKKGDEEGYSPDEKKKGKKGDDGRYSFDEREKDGKRDEARYSFKDKLGKSDEPGYSFRERDKSRGSGIPYEGRDKPKGSGIYFDERDIAKGRRATSPLDMRHGSRSPYDEEISGRQGEAGTKTGIVCPPCIPRVCTEEKWDTIEKMDYYTPRHASKDSIERAYSRQSPTQSLPVERAYSHHSPTQSPLVERTYSRHSPKQSSLVERTYSPTRSLLVERAYSRHSPTQSPQVERTYSRHSPTQSPQVERTYSRHSPTQSPHVERTYSRHSPTQSPHTERTYPRQSPTQNTADALATDSAPEDDYENRRGKSMSHKSGSEGSLAKVIWEKDMIEKNLFKSTCLLTKALGKLEKIDDIIQTADEEREKLRKGEIQEAFRKPTVNCIYLQGKRNPESTPSGGGIKYRVRSLGEQEKQDTLKCSELLRQISGLREKLKKNQECQQKVNEEITMSQRETGSGPPPHVIDLNSEGETQMRRLQKKLEKLINHRGKLLSDMCQALTQLNNLKRCKNSRLDIRQRTRSGENRNTTFRREPCYCGCRNCLSSESERAHYSDSGSSTNNHFRRMYGNFNRDDDRSNNYYPSTDNLDSGQRNLKNVSRMKTNTLSETYASKGDFYPDNPREKELKKSILKFCCPSPPCREEPDTDVDAPERYLLSGERSPNRRALSSRPSTSPTTKREKRDASEEPRFASYGSTPQETPERRVKSETTMKEIEKTLRNYEQRLNDMDGLEYKVEEWKRKLLEACKWKRNASKVEMQMKREQENERNRASMEINGLFSQNYELKKQVRQLTDKSKEQAKKIQNMKSGILKARELESETEELKKELSEYRNSYEHQRKCISKWESVVALQRKEIENLMNHIRKLTTERKEQVVCCSDKKFAQRTRSCSPVTLVDCQSYCRPETAYKLHSDEENGSCCCQDFRQSDSRRTHLRFFDKNYYSSLNERDDWCA